MNKQGHVAKCWVTLSRAAYGTVLCLALHLEPSLAFVSVQCVFLKGKRSRGKYDLHS